MAELLETGQSNHPAIVIPDGPRVTYAELRAQVESLALALWEAGVRPGETVSIVLGNNLEYVVAFLAVVRLGAIAAPLNPNYTAAELQFYMEDAGAKTLLLPPGEHPSRGAAEALKMSCLEVGLANGGTVRLSRGGQVLTGNGDIEPPDPAAIALFLHTSGTTSRPKGVPLTHANITASIANIRATYDLSSDDVSLAVMPLFHVHGLIGVVFSTLCSGGTVVISQRFSASRFWGDVAEYRVNWYSGAPTIHQILLNRADPDGAPRNPFRFIRSCSAALAPAVLKEMEARFESPVVEAYGMT
ncbi:MAG: AMP-binding protein, partial [Dehalococcoidia bacterium]